MVSPTKMCEKCFAELVVLNSKTKIDGVEVVSLYLYNEKFKTMLYHLKGLGDIELASVFLERERLWLKAEYFNYILVPAPSSKESDAKRGFNHVEVMFQSLGLKMLPLVYKTADFKQSDLHFTARQKVGEKLAIRSGEKLMGKHILIVDDIKTTGATIKAMISLIKPFSPKKLKVLTLAATKLNT